MKYAYNFKKGPLEKIKTDLFVVLCRKSPGDEKKPGALLNTDGGLYLDKKLDGLLSRILKEEEFTGEKGKPKVINTRGRIGAKNILVIGAGDIKEFNLDTLRVIGSRIAKVANQLKAGSVAGVLQPEKVANLPAAVRMQAFAEGLSLGSYAFTRYKNPKDADKQTLKEVIIATKANLDQAKDAISLGTEIAEAISYVRDLVNTPGYDMTPDSLAKEAQKICRAKGLTCRVLDEAGIKKENMRLLTAVSQGSPNPPRFIHMKYTPAGKAKMKVALVGKGITFDSGGCNLKTSKHIENMKNDMAGGAAVLGVMKLLPIVKPRVQVDAYIPACENMVDGKAHKPGDIIRSRSGKTVEILNTDAEGRLILVDAFDFALQGKPDMLIDIATLTGGVLYALGEIYTALLGNDQKLVDRLLAASAKGGEPTWQLPLVAEYLKGLKEGIADLNNVGKTFAMTISGALFLKEFVGEVKWAHFDIAESAYSNEERDYRTKGGTGAGVQTMINFLMGC